MNFKDNERFQKEFWQIDPRLRQILCDMEVLAYPDPMTITCLIRTEEENQAVGAATLIHCLGRAADVRMFKKMSTNDMLLDQINKIYCYDPKRSNLKTLILHKTEDGAFHLHAQVRAIDVIHKELGLDVA